jgi:formiminotetrahydrofolate cyclodeaminase
MNKVIVLTVLSLIALVVFMTIGKERYNASDYVSQEVLDTASPLNVSIDTEFLHKLVPAYEQQ